MRRMLIGAVAALIATAAMARTPHVPPEVIGYICGVTEAMQELARIADQMIPAAPADVNCDSIYQTVRKAGFPRLKDYAP